MSDGGAALVQHVTLQLARAHERGAIARFLFLDDDLSRHAVFDTMAIGCSVAHVWTARECIETLVREGETFDCAFLDHDLGGDIFVTEIEGSGAEVAYFIRDHLPPTRCPRFFVVHSLNPDGAQRMTDALRERGMPVDRIPFSFPDDGMF